MRTTPKQSLGNLKLGLGTLIGRTGEDPIRELIAVCGLQTILERIDKDATQNLEDTAQEVKGTIGELLADWDKARHVEKSWESMNKVLVGPLATQIGLDLAVAREAASGEIKAWREGFQADLRRTGSELRVAANQSLDDLKAIAGAQLSGEALQTMGDMLAQALSAPALKDPAKFADEIQKLLPQGVPAQLTRRLSQGDALSETDAQELAASLESYVTTKATEFIKENLKLDENATHAIDLLESIGKLGDRPVLPSGESTFASVQAYAGVAQAALQMLGQSSGARDVGKAVAVAQTGIQLYQAATVLMAASGFGVAIAAVGMLGGLSSLTALGGSGPPDQRQEVLEAIAKLQAYLVEQFKALNVRLDRIEENLAALRQVIAALSLKVEELKWRLATLQQDTRSMQMQLALGNLAILEEIDEQMTVEWDALRAGRLPLTAEDIVRYKAFFTDRAHDAFDQVRNLDTPLIDAPFEQLGQFVRALSTQQMSEAPAFAKEDSTGRAAVPTALLMSALNYYTAIDMGTSKGVIQGVRATVNPAIALAAIERYVDVHKAEAGIEGVHDAAPGLKASTRRQLGTLRMTMDCVQGMASLVGDADPANPTSTLGMLWKLLLAQLQELNADFEQLEWHAVKSYMLDVMRLASDGEEPATHRQRWSSSLPTAWDSIALNIAPGQDQAFPELHKLVLNHPWFTGALPSLLVRNLPGESAPALELLMVVDPGAEPAFAAGGDWRTGTMTVTYNMAFSLYGKPVEALNSNWAISIFFNGLLGPSTSDSIWSRMSDPTYNAVYKYHPRRHWYWAVNQYDTKVDAALFPSADPENKTVWGEIKKRLRAENDRVIKWISDEKFHSVCEAFTRADAEGYQSVAAVLQTGIHARRPSIFADFLKQESGNKNSPVEGVKGRLRNIENLLITVRAVLLVGMPEAYLHVDLLHALYDGGADPTQLRLPRADLLNPENWQAFSATVRAEVKRDLAQALPMALREIRPFDSPTAELPYVAVMRRSVDALMYCISRMCAMSAETSVPYRVHRANRLLEAVEASAGVVTAGGGGARERWQASASDKVCPPGQGNGGVRFGCPISKME